MEVIVDAAIEGCASIETWHAVSGKLKKSLD